MGRIKRWTEQERPTADGFSSLLVWEQGPEGPVLVGRIQHHLTKKAQKLAKLFLQIAPRGGEFSMSLARQTPLSVAEKWDGEPGFATNTMDGTVYLADKCIVARDKPSRKYRIFVWGRSKLELEMWRSVALDASDKFQEAESRRRWRA